jgi:uncharacterized membrane protein
VFAISVISVPLLTARRIDTVTAISASLAAVVLNPKPMALWAGLIAGFMALGIATIFVGLVFVFPLIGHANTRLGIWLGVGRHVDRPTMIGLLVFWLVLIVAMIRSLNNGRERPGVRLRTPREILDEHFAKGEIDRNAYVERSKTFDLSAATL